CARSPGYGSSYFDYW
nr:immunoglobulin heavy chain junction region [Mus musculus]